METQIKQLRLARQLSQEELAERAQVSVRTIQRLETGEDVSISTLNLVAGALGVEVADLFQKQRQSDSPQAEKVQAASDQSEYQLHERQTELKTANGIYNSVYVVAMLGLCFFGDAWNDQFWDSAWVLTWIAGWMLMGPIKRLLVQKLWGPKLDTKYPLTQNRVDKNYFH